MNRPVFRLRSMMPVGLAVGLLATGLVACGQGPSAPPEPPGAQLASIAVGSATGAGEAGGWEGVVEATRSVVLSAQTTGRIERVEVDVDDPVKAGQVLVRITATEQAASAAAARAQLRSAEAQAVEAESRYRRSQELVAQQLVSRQDHEQVKAARDSAVAAKDSAAAQLAQVGQLLAYTTVRAPYAGLVSRRHVEPGETVSPGQALIEMHAPGELRVEVEVPESVADAIRATPAARIRIGDGREVEAASLVVYPAADPATHSVTVRAKLPAMENPPRPGQTVRVGFAGNSAPASTWIPASALVQRGELTGVYVLKEGSVLLRQLRLGRRQGDRVEVIAGLSPGDSIAADPLAALQALSVQHAVAADGHE